MSKPFKTNTQQLKILRSRNLITCINCKKLDEKEENKCEFCNINKNNSPALRILEKENYYSVINGYNKLFLYPKNDESKVDKYRHGSTIYEIYELYLLDKKLRSLLLQELLKYEHYLKTKCAYFFSKNYTGENDYLNYSNFSGDSKDIINNINYITKVLSSKNIKNSPINHYIENYDSIPLWVIVNHFTFGNIRYFYEVCNEDIKKDILNSFNEDFRRNYPKIYKKVKLDECMIPLMNIITNFYRNTSAHNELMYDRRVHDFNKQFEKKKKKGGLKLPKEHLKELSDKFEISYTTLNKGSFFTMIFYLKFFIIKDDYILFINKIQNEIDKTMEKIKTIKEERLLEEMGFINHIEDWNEKLLVEDI